MSESNSHDIDRRAQVFVRGDYLAHNVFATERIDLPRGRVVKEDSFETATVTRRKEYHYEAETVHEAAEIVAKLEYLRQMVSIGQSVRLAGSGSGSDFAGASAAARRGSGS